MTDILDMEFFSNDLNERVTLRQYLRELLLALWLEQDNFSGKRPLGNSGWVGDIEIGLIENGLVEGSLDPDGYVGTVNRGQVDQVVRAAIEELS